MHQNLFNAEFASVWHLNVEIISAHVTWVMKALTKVLQAFAAYIPAVNRIFWVKSLSINAIF
jgi:hypothetical protein